MRVMGKILRGKCRETPSWLSWQHVRVLHAIEHCRTSALGGHLDRCSDAVIAPSR
jgi:hypothetical protein